MTDGPLREERVPSTEATAIQTMSSLISPLRLIREIYQLKRRRVVTEGRNRNESQVRSRVFAKLNQRALLTTDQRNRSLRDKGSCSLMTVSRSVEESIVKVRCSAEERVIRRPKAAVAPSLTLPSTPPLSHEHSSLGFPSEGRNFGTTGGVVPKTIVVG